MKFSDMTKKKSTITKTTTTNIEWENYKLLSFKEINKRNGKRTNKMNLNLVH